MLQVIEKHLDRHPRAGKTGGAAHTLPVDPHHLIELGFLLHCHAFQVSRKILDMQTAKRKWITVTGRRRRTWWLWE
jgi:hypothetical protein